MENTTMSRPVQSQHRSGYRTLLLVGGTLIGMLAIVFAVVSARTPAAPSATPVPHFVDPAQQNSAGDAALRTLYIGAKGQRLPLSGTGGLLLATLETGTLPAGKAQAVVQSDANCQPDENGVSHCLNQLAIGNTTIVVRHHHKMSETPCLTPGEVVRLTDRLDLNG
jgi:hypothetical protein